MPPKVSVIVIALREEETQAIRKSLAEQTFQDFELVVELGGTAPQAWNRALDRAQGDIVVFTETDAQPVTQNWLQELVDSVPDDATVVKGLEVTGQPWDLANLACYRSVIGDLRFEEKFPLGEDTDMFGRLRQRGIRFLQVPTAPVIHLQKWTNKRTIRRAFRYGLYHARMRLRYGDVVEIAGVEYAFKRLVGAVLNLLGALVGYLLYWPERLWLRSRTVRGR